MASQCNHQVSNMHVKNMSPFFIKTQTTGDWFRGSHGDLLLIIHPDTASISGIQEGHCVYIETARARIIPKTELTERIFPHSINAEDSWAFKAAKTSILGIHVKGSVKE